MTKVYRLDNLDAEKLYAVLRNGQIANPRKVAWQLCQTIVVSVVAAFLIGVVLTKIARRIKEG